MDHASFASIRGDIPAIRDPGQLQAHIELIAQSEQKIAQVKAKIVRADRRSIVL
jgi:hypothetical protein